MDLARTKEIFDGLFELRGYFIQYFKRGVADGIWVVQSSDDKDGKHKTYCLNYYPDGSYDCTCECFKHRGACKHGYTLKILMRLQSYQDEQDRELRPLILNEVHIKILQWFKENHITDATVAVTSRHVIHKMRCPEFPNPDQTNRARTSELRIHGYLLTVEDVIDGDRAPMNSHYFISQRGRDAVGTNV